MSILPLFGYLALAITLGAAFTAYAQYSKFLSHLRKVAPEQIEPLSLVVTESASAKNTEIFFYFWHKKYLGNDSAINAIGQSIRFWYFSAILMAFVAVFCFSIGSTNG